MDGVITMSAFGGRIAGYTTERYELTPVNGSLHLCVHTYLCVNGQALAYKSYYRQKA